MLKTEIYQLLKAKKITTPMIGASLDVSPQSIRSVITNGRGSRRIAQAVANICDKNLYDLFPYYESIDTEKTMQVKKQAELDKKLAKLA